MDKQHTHPHATKPFPPAPQCDSDGFMRPFVVPVEIRDSAIHGQGVFLVEPAARGTVLCNLFRSPDVHFAHSEQILAMWRKDPEWMTLVTGRISGDYFAYGTYQDAECFLNHSHTPNALNYLGQTIALRHLAAGEEITIDYRLLFAEGMGFDGQDGPIFGYSNAEADRIASQMLAGLLLI